ncbi:MAG TPA: hypothetical protein VKR61_02875 [Bryobacteraceae bacterium]|nr:hypothetical protein [Bryobacteraceae bacterium]
MSSSAPSASLRSLFSELEQLFQTETEARVSTSVQAAERALAEHLNQSVRRLRQADGFAALAAVLCDASVRFSDACAVFQVNEGRIKGERLRGAASPAAAQFKELQFAAADAAAFGGAIESREPVVALCSASEISPAVAEVFSHAPQDRAYLFPLNVDDTAVGVLYASGAVESAALELLTQATAAILEARQRPAQRQTPDLVRIQPATERNVGQAPDWDGLSPAERNLHLRAQRFARVQVAEMRLYRQSAVKAGRARGDMYTALRDAIDGGREAYRQTFLTTTTTMVDYFHEELVRTLANDNPAWMGDEYPGPLV